MSTPIGIFDYELPEDLIAQGSIFPRDHSRLMVFDRVSGQWKHKKFFEIVDELREGDVLVMNDTKVFRARLKGLIGKREVEVFLLRAFGEYEWEVLLKPGKRVRVGDEIALGDIHARVIEKGETVKIIVDREKNCLLDFAQKHGEIPVPPYVREMPKTLEQYQTVYARETGSVAAPTAGFHFTRELLDKVRSKGVNIEFVTLHVGLGTFRPMKSATIEDHKMHSEFATIPPGVAQTINNAKREGRRVIAVGTTTARTLEGARGEGRGVRGEERGNGEQGTVNSEKGGGERWVLPAEGFSGDLSLFIKPGFDFKVIDGLITNFHLPKSTLLVLVSAFAGRDRMLTAYQEAIAQRYRFFSFGDAMFIR
jgi:S-adenosylmethionine:tRNA ribosyltransferase-isomerase